MLVACDLDEVLADLIPPLIHYHNTMYGTNLSKDKVHRYNLWEVWGGTKEEAINKVHDFYLTEDFKNILPVPDSQKAISVLSKKNELIIITSRPTHLYDNTISWVEKHFPNLFSEVYLTNQWSKSNPGKSKSEVCTDLGVNLLIEDSFDHAKECAQSGVKILLMDRPWNQEQNLPQGITRVKSWEEVVQQFK